MTADAVGGVWRYGVDLSGALARRGIHTTIAVMGPAPDPGQRREAQLAGAVVIDRPYRLEWMADPWPDVERAGGWLLTLERSVKPDVVHLNGYAHAVLPWSAPVLVVAHSCVRSWWRAVRDEEAPCGLDDYRVAVAAGLRAARLVVAPTRAMLGALDREYGAVPRSHVIPNGCRDQPSAGSQELRSKERLILAAARLWDESKNIAALCTGAARLTWPMYAAGDTRGPDGVDCSLPGVHLLGRLSRTALTDWYRRAAIFVAPSRYEPFGLSVLEAASAGCALVLGDISSLRENWADAAVFAPPHDHQMLLEAIQQLIDQPGRRLDLAERARTRASEFTIERTAGEYLRVYESLLE